MKDGNRFKFYFDYMASPFWPADSETWDKWGHTRRHEVLPLTSETSQSCEELSIWYDTIIDWSDPGGDLLWDRAENERFLVAARELFRKAQAELGEDFELTDGLDLNDIIEEGYSPPERSTLAAFPVQRSMQSLPAPQPPIGAKARERLSQAWQLFIRRIVFDIRAVFTIKRFYSRDETSDDLRVQPNFNRHHLPLTRYKPAKLPKQDVAAEKKGRQ